MYLALISRPYIGMHKWTSWAHSIYVIDVQDDKSARTIVRQLCGEKDPEVERALLEQDDRKEGEYFDVLLYQVPFIAVCVPEPSSGFPKPHISLRM